jgi:hypothetical protein
MQRLNFGIRALRHPLDPTYLADQIARYDARDAGAVSRYVRSTASLDTAIETLLAIYEDAIAEHRLDPRPIHEDLRAAADYLAHIGLAHHRADGIKTAALELARAMYGHARGWPLVRRLARSRSLIRWTAAARRHWGTVD